MHLLLKPEELNEELDAIQIITKSGTPTLEQMQEYVGGWIDIVRLGPSPLRDGVEIDAVVDDEGLINGRSRIGTFLAMKVNDESYTQPLAGNVVFIATDKEGETVALLEQEVELLRESFRLGRSKLDGLPAMLLTVPLTSEE